MSSPFILIDGQFFRNEDRLFSLDETRQILFTETIRAIRDQFMFWDDHLALINLQLNLLNIKTPVFLKEGARELKRQMERMLVKNKLYKSALIDISFYRNDSKVGYILKTTGLGETSYELNKDGLTLELFDKFNKAVSSISLLRIGSELYWRCMTQGMANNEFLLQNNNQCLLETPGKNIYLIKGNDILTPAPETGVYINPSKRIIRQLTENSGCNFLEVTHISTDDLKVADEVFLASDTYGINWVKAFEMKRYFNKRIKVISEEFNTELVQ